MLLTGLYSFEIPKVMKTHINLLILPEFLKYPYNPIGLHVQKNLLNTTSGCFLQLSGKA